MIEVNKLCFSYTIKPFVENVSFHVGRGNLRLSGAIRRR